MVGRREWTIRTSDGRSIVANRARNNLPEYRRGGTVSIEFTFDDREDVTSDTGAEYNYSEYGRFTYSSSGELRGFKAYESLREYGDYAGAVAFGTDINGLPWYREQVPVKSNVESLVVNVVPGAEVRGKVSGIWALILGVTDETTPPLNYHVLDVEFGILAKSSKYDGISEVKTKLEK